MNGNRSEAGFTLIEILVAIGLLMLVSVTIYNLMFSAVRSTDTSEEVVRVSEEGRLGLNRMIRDTREGQVFGVVSANSYSVKVDFNGDGTYSNALGNYEILEFEYVWNKRAILLNDEVLVAGAEPIGSTETTQITTIPVFSFTSNDLYYDSSNDGVTTSQELQCCGLDPSDSSLYHNVEIAFQVREGDQLTVFRGQAQLRNRR
jgi:type II secretory pathway pseudopilin PulG